MKVVILAGGFGTRLSEETEIKPKPMIDIGGKPILWHIQKIYASYGFNEFVIALGYKGEVIKQFFLEYYRMNGSMTVNFQTGSVSSHNAGYENWHVHLVDTGIVTMTGGRLKRLENWLKDEPFMVTYGDGLSNVNINALLSFHQSQKKVASITAVRPPARFGELAFQGSLVSNFHEKPLNGDGWINGGFMVFEPQIFDYLEGDTSVLERDGLEHLANLSQLAAYRHEGFWQCMDTINDKRYLENLWQSENPPWKVWENTVNLTSLSREKP